MNPLTAIEVCNSALMNMGTAYQINSFNDQDAPSRLCRQFYPQARRQFLGYTELDFSFATAREKLVSVVGYDKGYQMPSNAVRIISIAGDDRRNYRVEGDKIYTDVVDPVLIFIEDDPSLKYYPPDAVEAVTYYLSAKLAISMKQDINLSNSFLQRAEQYCKKVAKADIRNHQKDTYPTFGSEIVGAR